MSKQRSLKEILLNQRRRSNLRIEITKNIRLIPKVLFPSSYTNIYFFCSLNLQVVANLSKHRISEIKGEVIKEMHLSRIMTFENRRSLVQNDKSISYGRKSTPFSLLDD